jgi:hypothetical protein
MYIIILAFGFPVTLVISHGGTTGIDTLPIAHTLQYTYSALIPITILTWERWYPECTADDITRSAPQEWFHDSQLVHDAPRNCPDIRNAICPITNEVLQCRVTVVLIYFNATLYQGPSEGGRNLRWGC